MDAKSSLLGVAILGWLLVHGVGAEPLPVDDALRFTNLGNHLTPNAPLGQAAAGVFLIEEERRHGRTLIYVGRVVVPIKRLELDQRVAFHDRDRSQQKIPDWREVAPRVYPMMAVGREYLVFVRYDGPDLDIFPEGKLLKHPVAWLLRCSTIRADLRDVRSIVPQLRSLADIMDMPWDKRPGPLRELLFANLDTRHEYLRYIVETEFAHSQDAYRGMTAQEAARLAQWAQTAGGLQRSNIMRSLAKRTPHPMDYWFLQPVTEGAPGRLRPGDAAGLAAFEDSLYQAAKHLSIDSYWPMLERKTRPMSMWVVAFAQKADPRLLPIILRYLEPTRSDAEAVSALAHYKGKPEAAQALIEHLKKTNDLGEDKQAQKLVHEALLKVGTPEALREARRLRQVKKLE